MATPVKLTSSGSWPGRVCRPPSSVCGCKRRSPVSTSRCCMGGPGAWPRMSTAASDLSNLSSLGDTAGTDIVLISLFVVASTVALSVAERARTMALLRAVGATPGQVRRTVMLELAVLGIVAGLVAYLLGTWLAEMSVRGLVAHELAPPSTHAWASPLELLPSTVAAVVVAELAGFFAARRASRIRPAAALEEATIERHFPRPVRLLLGIGAFAGGLVLAVFALRQPDALQQLTQAQFVLLAFMAGIALLGPYLMPWPSGSSIYRWSLLAGPPAASPPPTCGPVLVARRRPS